MFSLKEILNIAIGIEEGGIEFYQEAQKISPKDLKDVFKFLEKEEMKHKAFFEELLKNVDEKTEININEEEYEQYAKSIGQHAIFKKFELQSKVEKLKSIEEALQLAIEKEIQSIEYYKFLIKTQPERTKATLNEIIKEEEQHAATLKNILEKIKR